jgi:hypothetical protein
MMREHTARGEQAGGCISRRGLILGGLALAGCSPSNARPTIEGLDEPVASGEIYASAVQELLDRRAKALLAKDERTFLADLDESNDALIRKQKMLFDNLTQLEFKSLRYIVPGSRWTPENGVYPVRPVLQVTQLTIDDGPSDVAPAEGYQFSLARKGDKLVITDVIHGTMQNRAELLLPANLLTDVPWDSTPLQVKRVGNVWLAADSSVPNLDEYASAASSQVEFVERLWGDRTKFPGSLLFFTNDADNFAAWYGLGQSPDKDQLDKIEGITAALFGVRNDGRVYNGQYVGARIVVSLENIADWGDDPALVMRHELAHGITSRARSTDIGVGISMGAPRWAVEGFARWTETIDNPRRRQAEAWAASQGAAAGKFKGVPTSDTFYDDAVFNYALSSTIFSFVEELKGRETAVEFYAKTIKYSEFETSNFVDKPAFDGICRRVLGMGAATFLDRWASFVRAGA